MRIDDTPSGTFRPISPRAEIGADDARSKTRPEATPTSATPERPRRDTVEFSNAARSLAEDSTSAVRGEQSLSPARRDAIRQRVLEGAYNQQSVIDQVAQRLLRSGDL
jgi:hypothetical protein